LAISFIETHLFDALRPSRVGPVLEALGDLTRSRAERVAENALLWHQLGVLQRQVKRPRLTKGDRQGLLFWARRLRDWRHALLIVRPDTLLRWHHDYRLAA
jgi:hypothetical protein